jgi:hypothetical protein
MYNRDITGQHSTGVTDSTLTRKENEMIERPSNEELCELLIFVNKEVEQLIEE